MNYNSIGNQFSFTVSDCFNFDRRYDDEIFNGIFVCQNKKTEFIIPIIDDIMIWISPEFIKDEYEIKKLSSILEEAVNSGFHTLICEDYLKALTKDSESTQGEEIIFYENKYKKRYEVISEKFNEYGDYLISAKVEILDYLKSSFYNGIKVLEISGGDFYCMRYSYPPSEYNYNFIGTEISFWGLKCGKKFFPNALMIQANLDDKLHFSNESIDLLFIKGVLHHALKKENALIDLIPLIKRNGYLGIQEVILDTVRKSVWIKFFKTIIEPEVKTSPLNESINKKIFLDIYYNNFEPLNYLEHGSIFKLISNKLFLKLKTKSLSASRFLHFTDKYINKIPILGSFWITSTHLVSTAGRRK